jgi:hypothetical protein
MKMMLLLFLDSVRSERELMRKKLSSGDDS